MGRPPVPIDITIWSWKDAPQMLRSHSNHGGDEDFVILIGEKEFENYWVEKIIDTLTVCDYQEVEIEYLGFKHKLYITAHS